MKEIKITEESSTLEMWITNENTLYIDIDIIDPDAMYRNRSSWIEIPMDKVKKLKDFINNL